MPVLPREKMTLQWDRGFETAEIALEAKKPATSTRLQWGRGFETAEIVIGLPATPAPVSFNGAAVLKPRR